MTDHTQMTQPRNPRNTVHHGPEVVRLDTVSPSTVKWLWNQRVALGKLTLIAGDPGLGKSYLTLDLASRVSTGRAMPGDTWENGRPMDRFPGTSILLSAEDDAADTIRPRLDAAGADLRRVSMVTGVRTGGAVTGFNLRDHLKFLRQMCEADPEARLIVIDPISAYLGDDEGHSNTKVRNLLAPLAKLAQDYNVAVLAVTHLNKAGGGGAQSAIYRAMGSLAFTAAARTVHLVSRDPDDPERRLLVPIKNNLGQDRSGYGFTIGLTPQGESTVCWEDGPTHESADALLARLSRTAARDAAPSPKTDEAAAWVRDRLGEGPVPSRELEQSAQQAGISQRTLMRARASIGVRVTKRADGWVCELPTSQQQAMAFEPMQ
ncbi:MAG: AAA family ATPase [Phycisphaeraceae bacterium]